MQHTYLDSIGTSWEYLRIYEDLRACCTVPPVGSVRLVATHYILLEVWLQFSVSFCMSLVGTCISTGHLPHWTGCLHFLRYLESICCFEKANTTTGLPQPPPESVNDVRRRTGNVGGGVRPVCQRHGALLYAITLPHAGLIKVILPFDGHVQFELGYANYVGGISKRAEVASYVNAQPS